MRNKERIKPFLNVLARYWKLYPDFRFWQLILMLNDTFESDPFFMEEDKLIDHIEGLIKKKEEFINARKNSPRD